MPSVAALLVALALGAEREASPAPTLVLLPATTSLVSSSARQSLVLERIQDGAYAGELRDGVTYESSDPGVALVEAGQIVPQGNGTATLTARSPEGTATATVTVEGFEQPMAWSFRRHVLPVLAKAGCNSGACHGAAAGKNGFRLSLRGFDPLTDWRTLTRQAHARRVLPSDPARSLMLLKPTGATPHRGGVRLDVGSPDYQVLAQWIAQGAAPPREDDPTIRRLEILPEHALLTPGAQQSLVVRAHYTDGRADDVTRWVKFASTDDAVCQVSDDGKVSAVGPGEAALTAWFASRIAVASITSPRPGDLPSGAFDHPPHNFIDELVLAKLRRLRVPPSPTCDDATFLRRASLDTIGVLPTPEEAQAFLADPSPDKRARLVDTLLARPEFVDYWTYKWCDLLLVNSAKLSGPALWAYQRWIRDRVAADTPWDVLARELLTASGSTLENGAANFFVLHGDPQTLAETTTQALLGTSINCARCHNHPLEKWTNAQYFAMANLFSRVRVKTGGRDGERIVYPATEGDLVHPLVGRPQPPQPLDGAVVPADATRDRREYLADWLTAPDNPFFARAVANRVWANFLGQGLVEAVDDLRVSNPASNEELLSALADHLRAHRYDLKSLMREILNSSTYQRSSQTLPENVGDQRHYARFYPRRLMSETLLDAVSQVTEAPTEFAGYPAGYRALQLPDAAVPSYFLKTFGRPDRVITCECERNAEPNMVQALHLANGDTLNQKLAAPRNRIARLLESGASDEAMLDELYLAALTRPPTGPEREQFLAELAAVPTGDAAVRRQVWEDLYWSVLGSKEFLFND